MRSQGLSEHDLSNPDRQKLDRFYQDTQAQAERLLGHPCNALFDYSPLVLGVLGGKIHLTVISVLQPALPLAI
jgi:hypothetical protein